MAVTIGNFTAINDSEVDAESPITESLVTRLRDNAYWVNAGTTKTTESTANKFLETDGSGGVQWTNTSDIGVDGTKGAGSVSGNSGSPTQIAEVTDKIILVSIRGFGDGISNPVVLDVFIDQSDSTYSAAYLEDGGSQGSGTGTLTGSFVELGAGQFFRVTGGNIEIYENNSSGASYTYVWL